MFAQFPFINIFLSAYLLSMLGAVLFAMGWCDPAEYKKQPVIDAICGVSSIYAFIFIGKIMRIAKTAKPASGKSLGDAFVPFGQAYYDSIVSNGGIEKSGNQLMGLLQVGIGEIFSIIFGVIAMLLSIYFIFRMFALLDLYINNMTRYAVMGISLFVGIVLGILFDQTRIMLIFLLFGILSLVILGWGNIMLAVGKHRGKIPAPFGKSGRGPGFDGEREVPMRRTQDGRAALPYRKQAAAQRPVQAPSNPQRGKSAPPPAAPGGFVPRQAKPSIAPKND